PRPQHRLLDEVLRPLPIAVAQPQGMREQRVAVLGMQRADELVVVRHLRLSPVLLGPPPLGGASAGPTFCTRFTQPRFNLGWTASYRSRTQGRRWVGPIRRRVRRPGRPTPGQAYG